MPHINEVKCTWCVKKGCILSYKKTLKFLKIKIGYDLKLSSFKKMKHGIYKELGHFQFIQQWWRKKCHVLGQL